MCRKIRFDGLKKLQFFLELNNPMVCIICRFQQNSRCNILLEVESNCPCHEATQELHFVSLSSIMLDGFTL